MSFEIERRATVTVTVERESLLDQIAAAESMPVATPSILAEIRTSKIPAWFRAEMAKPITEVVLERKVPCWACGHYPCIGHVRGHRIEYYTELRNTR